MSGLSSAHSKKSIKTMSDLVDDLEWQLDCVSELQMTISSLRVVIGEAERHLAGRIEVVGPQG